MGDRGSLAAYVWSYEPARRRRQLDWKTLMQLGPAEEAAAMSKDLKRRGWSFVGPTTIYSVMESIGLVNDHMGKCHIRREVDEARSRFARPE